ncbi:hypothetical protein [Sediminibacterium ginsengisoli]|uniref:Uncharacterized protein n=1 Tax=Sediminibacterium ginsengisoli TaxID=413434 RepID=A0A1T4Q3C9_9BACT|nr:hypothetical protein [Sediminibacterium ginsengisoli]SJZ97991.1 hypothetical protein SAMN04488132_107111 [Sediminibacterium ginsengisoli]
MEDKELMQLWKTYDARLLQNLVFNQQQAADIAQLKVQSLLSSMKPVKLFALVTGIAWVGFVDVIIITSYTYASWYFIISALIQVILTKIAIGVYLYQLVLIYKTDISASVLQTQEKLARLRSSTLWITRLLFLQLPVWTTFYITQDMISRNSLLFYSVQVPITLLFSAAAIWLFINIRYSNRYRKWFRLIFSGAEWDPVMKSMELLEQADDFRR